MKTFADNAARTWAITVNVAAVKRCRDLLGINLLEIADQKGKLLERIIEDPCILCDILFVLVKPEADARNVTDEEFGRGLGGDVLDAATDALLGEIADFFPSGRREILRRILSKVKMIQQKTEKLALVKLSDPKLDEMLDRQIEAAMDAALAPQTNATSAASPSPESPASNPVHTRSES